MFNFLIEYLQKFIKKLANSELKSCSSNPNRPSFRSQIWIFYSTPFYFDASLNLRIQST